MSEALILESVNPQYDERLFIKLQPFFVHNMFLTCIFHEQSLVIFWVITDARMRALEKDLPVK